MIQLFKCALLQKQIPHYAHIQGEFFYILQSNSSLSVFTLHMFIPVENLTYIVINHQKGEIVSASSATPSWFWSIDDKPS